MINLSSQESYENIFQKNNMVNFHFYAQEQ